MGVSKTTIGIIITLLVLLLLAAAAMLVCCWLGSCSWVVAEWREAFGCKAEKDVDGKDSDTKDLEQGRRSASQKLGETGK